MKKFNLTFSGEIQRGQEPARVKSRFAKLFAIDDSDRLERFFSGDSIILRRNLDRREAAVCFQQMHELGVVAELVLVDPDAQATPNSSGGQKKHSEKTATNSAVAAARTPNNNRGESAAAKKQRRALKVQAEKVAREEAARTAAKRAEKARRAAEERAKREAEESARREAAEQVQREAAAIAAHKAELQAELDAVALAEHRAQTKLQELGLVDEGSTELPIERDAHQAQKAFDKSAGRSPRIAANFSRRGYAFSKRQPGEPNFFKLHAFRNTAAVRDRSTEAQNKARRGRLVTALGALALGAILVLGMRWQPEPPLLGAQAVAIDEGGGPLMLAGTSLILHNRAGQSTQVVPVAELGVSHLETPWSMPKAGEIFALGRLITAPSQHEDPGALQLLRCKLANTQCTPALIDAVDIPISNFVVNPILGDIIIASAEQNTLYKFNAEGELLTSRAVAIAEQPVMRLHDGLLYISSPQGAAISVLRFDDQAFGEQLDEILAMPPAAASAKQTQIVDFLWSGNGWWLGLRNPANGKLGLYRFSEEWNYLQAVLLPSGSRTLQLINWGDRTLVNNTLSTSLLRFNARGEAEVPLESESLRSLVHNQQRKAATIGQLWRVALVLGGLIVVLGGCYTRLQHLRKIVYQPRRERGAEPIDQHIEALDWVEHEPNRAPALQRRTIAYAVFATGAALIAVGQGLSAISLLALLIFLCGPAIALLLIARRPPGNIAVSDDALVIVDHRDMYHMGGTAQVQHRGNFLFIDDVALFAGNRLLPAFAPQQWRNKVATIAASGARVDRKTVLVKLLESRNPIMIGSSVIVLCTLTALLLFALRWIF